MRDNSNKVKRNKIQIVYFYILLFVIITLLILWYLWNLYLIGFINIKGKFDLETATKISPFFGSIVAPLITLASTLLVFENLREFKHNNLDNKNKNSTELTLKQCHFFLIDIQIDTKRLADLKIPGEGLGMSYYLKIPLSSNQICNNSTFNFVTNSIFTHHSEIILYFNKLELLSSCFLHGGLDIDLGEKIIGKTFIPQVQSMLPFIAYYKSEKDNGFADNILELYKRWGGEIPPKMADEKII